MKYNKGEWAESYAFLKALGDGYFLLIDESFKELQKVKILELYKNNFTGNKENIFFPSKSFTPLAISTLKDILSAKGTTSELKNLENLAKKYDFSISKANSRSKNDLEAKIIDILKRKSPRLGFSIKSFISSMPTLLNASRHTNFSYQIKNVSKEQVLKINSIKTRTKLKDKIAFIKEAGLIIDPKGASMEGFSSNLKRLDGDLEKILSFLLFYSYEKSKKDIKDLLEEIKLSNPLGFKKSELSFYKEKLLKFLMDIFTHFAYIKEEKASLFAGVLLVLKDGSLYLLDSIYHKKELESFLLKNLKFDSPSSSRYKMLELKYDKKNNTASFTLNIQLRFKNCNKK